MEAYVPQLALQVPGQLNNLEPSTKYIAVLQALPFPHLVVLQVPALDLLVQAA
jgi:hypothetical protein